MTDQSSREQLIQRMYARYGHQYTVGGVPKVDMSDHPILREVVAALRSPAPPEQEVAPVAGDTVTTSLAELANAAQVCIAREQEKPLPDNALIAVLCETVRLTREYPRHFIASPPAKVEPRMQEVERLLDVLEGRVRLHETRKTENQKERTEKYEQARTALLSAIASLGGDGKDGAQAKNAERYVWLRNHRHYPILEHVFDFTYAQIEHWTNEQNGQKMDSAVDQAISAERGSK